MKVVTRTLLIAATLLLGSAVLFEGDVAAQAAQIQQGVNDVGGAGSLSLGTVIKTVIDIFLYFIGALSVIMIIYGGFKYITSSGEASAVTSAKNTILYAVIGLIVSVLAFSIASFVAGIFNGQETQNTTQQSDPPVDPSTENSPSPDIIFGPRP